MAGCGFFDFEEREPWRAQAEAACYARGEVKLSSYIRQGAPIEGNGICGIDRPLKVSAIGDGTVGLGSKALALSCPMTSALERWLRSSVMPAAYAHYGSPVVEIRNFGTYNCRPRNNVRGARLSEHAFANAFDFAGVKLANGYVVTVKGGWYGSSADRAFLRDVTAGACGPFTTVLGPGSDRQHDDHLHLDLARHDAKGTRHYCKPHPTPSQLYSPEGVPMASLANPDVWKGAGSAATLPASRDLPTTGPSGFDQPLPPATVGGDGLAPVEAALAAHRAQPSGTTAGAVVSLPAVQARPVSAPACPPGYVCTPVGNGVPAATGGSPALGWHVGAQPVTGASDVGYGDGDLVTGSVSPYSDD